MTLDIDCQKCGDPLEEKGAIIFSPPVERKATKTHLCISCYNTIMDMIESDDSDN